MSRLKKLQPSRAMGTPCLAKRLARWMAWMAWMGWLAGWAGLAGWDGIEGSNIKQAGLPLRTVVPAPRNLDKFGRTTNHFGYYLGIGTGTPAPGASPTRASDSRLLRPSHHLLSLSLCLCVSAALALQGGLVSGWSKGGGDAAHCRKPTLGVETAFISSHRVILRRGVGS